MKLSRLLLISAVAISLTSCDDLFEPALENNQDISQMYKDPQFARGILDNAYLALPYANSPVTDVATDDAVTNNNSDNYKKMATGSWDANMNPVSQWDGRYHAIQYCNLMLENCDKVEWSYSTPVLKQMYCDNYKGNAYALRGLHLFYLLRAHAGMVDGQLMGVPIHLASETAASDFNLPRNTFKECIDQIMSDFDEALKYLPEQYGGLVRKGLEPDAHFRVQLCHSALPLRAAAAGFYGSVCFLIELVVDVALAQQLGLELYIVGHG